MPSKCCGWRPPRRLGPGCPGPRSPPPCGAAVANAGSTSGPRRSKQRCGRRSSQGSALVATAMGASVSATVAVIATMDAQIAELAEELDAHFEQHPDAEVVRSLPGLGTILSARVLGEFGDEPNRYATAKSRKNYAGTSPITRASGTKRMVLARHVRNQRLADAIYLWAFASLTRLTRSPGLLRLPTGRRRHPPRRPPRPRQPPRRHPPRLPRHHTDLRRDHRLGPPPENLIRHAA